MALPDQLVLGVGTQIIFADHGGDFVGGPTKTSLEVAGTDVQLDLTDLADGSARESAKVDLGANRAPAYSVMAAFEFETSPLPTAGDVVELYWAPSPIDTAANGNPMQIDGVDAAAPSGIGTLAELVKLCDFIGNFIVSNDGTGEGVQVGSVGILVPKERHGILIVKNEAGNAAAFHSDAVESHVVFNPITENIIE